MGYELQEILDAVTKNDISTNLFKDKVQNKFKLIQLDNIEEDIKIYRDEQDENAITTILRIIKRVKSHELTDIDIEKLPKVLVILLSGYADNKDKSKHAKEENKWRRCTARLLDELKNFQQEELFLRRYVAKQNSSHISKSKEHIKLSSKINKEELLSSVAKAIEHATDTCCHEINPTIEENKNVNITPYECRWPQMVLYHYDIYPLLPALLTCSVIYGHWQASSPAKTELLVPYMELPAWNTPIKNTRIIVREREHLYRQIENALEISLLPVAAPFVMLTPQMRMSPILNKEDVDAYLEEVKRCDTRISHRSKKFGILRCRSNELSRRLIQKFDMSHHAAQILRQDIDLYLHGLKKFNSAEAKEVFSDEIRSILKMCNTILSPRIYYAVDPNEPKQWHNIISEAIEKIPAASQKTVLDFFHLEELLGEKEALKLRCAKKFYKKYFYEQKLSLNIVEQTLPMPMIGKLSIGYYNTLLKFYRKQVRKQYWGTAALTRWIGSTNTEPTIEKLPSYIRTEVLNSFTLEDAFEIVNERVGVIKTSQQTLEERAEAYCRKKGLREVIKNYIRYVHNARLSIYQFLLKTSFDVIGHYAIALLRHCTIRQCELLVADEKEKEAENTSNGVQE